MGLCPGGCLSRGSLSGVSLSKGISFQGGSLSRGLCPGGCLSQEISVQGGLCPWRPSLWLRAGGTHPTKMHSCFCYLCGSHCSCTGHCSQYTLHTRYHWNTLKCTRWEVTLIKPYQVSCKKIIKQHKLSIQTFVFNFILLTGFEFNCIVRDFPCPWD